MEKLFFNENNVTKLIGLHGFFGQPRDITQLGLEHLYALNYFRIAPSTFSSWARRFNKNVDDDTILVGYSMGGRLLLHCLLDDPKKFRAAVVICAHPGLVNQHERHERYRADLAFAEKILTWPWKDLLEYWNASPVLKNSLPIPRSERDFCRRQLASYLRYFSLGQQQNLRAAINQITIPILWFMPEQESGRMHGISLKHPRSRCETIQHGGHRFMFEQPQLIARKINHFFSRIGIF